MKYELRKLCSKDIFPMSKLMSKIGISEFKQCFESDEIKAAIKNREKDGEEGKDESAIEAIGFSVILDIGEVILSHISDCETELYKFLSGLTGVSVAELENDSLADFAELVIAVAKKEEFGDFMKVVSKLLK